MFAIAKIMGMTKEEQNILFNEIELQLNKVKQNI